MAASAPVVDGQAFLAKLQQKGRLTLINKFHVEKVIPLESRSMVFNTGGGNAVNGNVMSIIDQLHLESLGPTGANRLSRQ